MLSGYASDGDGKALFPPLHSGGIALPHDELPDVFLGYILPK